MTSYQDCHRHFGYLTRETDIARKLLEKHGKASAQAVKELRGETDMPMGECADMLRCLWRDMELERLRTENTKLRKLATYALRHITEVECEGRSCKRCTKRSSTGCPRIMPWMFDVSGIEMEEMK